MKLIYTIIITFLILINCSYSQMFELGSWNILNLKYSINDKLSFFGESQLRSLKFYDNFHYYEYKAGVNYKIYDNFKLTLGAGSYQTFQEGGNFVTPKNNDEFRIWPQATLFQSIGSIKIEQRYRIEFRNTSSGFRNRFRYRLGLSFPFGEETSGYKPFLIGASNEIFFTDNEPYFERNRMLYALNYKPTKATTLQVGYLHQFDYKINDEIGRDFLQLGFFIELFHDQSSNSVIDIDIKDN